MNRIEKAALVLVGAGCFTHENVAHLPPQATPACWAAEHSTRIIAASDGTRRRLIPRSHGAAAYESRPARDAQLPVFGDRLAHAINKSVVEAGAAVGARVVADARLDAAMSDLAHALREGEQPYGAAVEFVLAHHGIVEPYPALRIVAGPAAGESGMARALGQQLGVPGGADDLVTLGVGIDRETSVMTIVLAIQDKGIDLEPIPRLLPAGGRARLAGELVGQFREPRVYVTDPAGAPRTVTTKVSGRRFDGTVPCDHGNGRYQIEVFGSDARGPRVLANFPVYCGVEPPAFFDGPAGYTSRTLKPAEAETRMLTLINRDRRTANLPEVTADPALAAIARAHSLDMLQNEFVGHVSPTSGGPTERLKRAGLSTGRLLENVGRAGSVEDLQAGLMRSPGHRAAVLDPLVSHVGIGIVPSQPAGQPLALLCTQLFR